MNYLLVLAEAQHQQIARLHSTPGRQIRWPEVNTFLGHSEDIEKNQAIYEKWANVEPLAASILWGSLCSTIDNWVRVWFSNRKSAYQQFRCDGHQLFLWIYWIAHSYSVWQCRGNLQCRWLWGIHVACVGHGMALRSSCLEGERCSIESL